MTDTYRRESLTRPTQPTKRPKRAVRRPPQTGIFRRMFGRTGLAVVALGTALLAAACGASGSAQSVSPGPATTVDPASTTVPAATPSPAVTPPVTTPTNVTSGPWQAATANLAGLPTGCGSLTLVSADPYRDEVIAGVANQGLWMTTSTAPTWTRLGQGPGSAVITNRPSAITYDPQHPLTFWENGIYGASSGAYQTQNNGTTFAPLGNLTHTDLISVDLNDPARQTLLSGRHEAPALYRSSDGGSTWADLSSRLPAGIGYTIAPLVLNAQNYLLGTNHGPAPGIFRTTNGGTTWTKVYPVPVLGPALVLKSGAIMWLLGDGTGLIESTNHGATWQFVSTKSSTSGSLIQLPNGWLAGIGQYLQISTDQGLTWTEIGPPLPYTATGFTYSPSQHAFYAWNSGCSFANNTSVAPNAIMRLHINLPA
jgi:BNR/Asp-box repeat